jgi:hypothetical protein
MSVNEKLEKLYSQHFDKALSAKKDLKISSPLLIKINEEKYNNSDLKIMIIGQETFGWHGEFGSDNIQKLMNGYDSYLTNNLKGKNKRVFWKAFHFFEKELNKFHYDKSTYYIWNNLIKISKYEDKGMTKNIRNFERNYFSVILDEIKILNPNIVIFLTGPNRDIDIKHNFSNVTFDNMGFPNTIKDKRNYTTAHKVISDELPEKSVRLYHPNYFGGYNKVKSIALDILKR